MQIQYSISDRIYDHTVLFFSVENSHFLFSLPKMSFLAEFQNFQTVFLANLFQESVFYGLIY